tara:strand:+ start:12477 stop:14105 length:1629 start_codon:yes stop_codon:yes gene_type:complete
MKKIIFIIFLIPCFSFSQKKDYKSYDKAVYYMNNNEIEKAKRYIEICIKKNESWELPYQFLGKIYEFEGNTEMAVKNYIKGIDVNKSEDQLWWERIGDLYFDSGLYDKALEKYKYFINFNDKDETIYERAKKRISDCIFSIKAIENPVEFVPENMGDKINSNMSEYLPFITIDGKKLIITRRVNDNLGLQEDFYISEKDDNDHWQFVKRMDNISTRYNEGAITISADGNYIVYTACNRKDSKGSCDLYLKNKFDNNFKNLEAVNSSSWDTQGCFSPDGRYLYFVSNRPGGYGGKDIWVSEISDNSFKKPINAGPNINTKYDEMSPFLHADNMTLYFASNGHIGMGKFDLFVSRRDEIYDDWNFPENLGYPINTYKVENSLIVESNGQTAYFVSDNSGFGLEDIFFFTLPIDKSANSISNLELDIISKKSGEEVILRNVQFDHNSYMLNKSSILELDELLSFLTKYPNINILIEGHTDSIGGYKENQILSEKRAFAVYKYLIENKINDYRLDYQGFGEIKPLSNNNNELGRMINRRTSFKIIH